MATSVVQNQRVRAQDAAKMSEGATARKLAQKNRAEAQFNVGGAPTSPNIYPSYSGTLTIVP